MLQDPRFKDVREEHPKNKLSKDVTLEVFQLEIFRLVRFLHPLNIPYILVKEVVFQLFRFRLVRDSQRANMFRA